MKNIIIKIAFLFFLANNFILATNPEWISFQLYYIDGSKDWDFIKPYDSNKVWISNTGYYTYKCTGNIIKLYYEDRFTNDIAKDKIGNLWLATGIGIYKISKIDTINYFFKTQYLDGVAIDTFNNKWFSSDSGIIKLQDTIWSIYNVQNSNLPSNDVSHICSNNKNEIWSVLNFDNKNGMIGKFNSSTWTFYDSSNTGISRLGDFIRITSDSTGRIWLRSDTLISYFDSAWHQVNNISSDSLRADGIWAQKDTIWLGGRGNLIYYVNGSPTYITMPSYAGNYIGTIGIDSNNNKWMLTYFDSSNVSQLTIYHEGGVIGNFICVDAYDNSVIDTSIVYPFIVAPNPFTSNISITYSLPQPAVTLVSICDLLGNTIAIIAQQQYNSGTINLNYDASGLSSGSYLLTLQVGSHI